MKHLFFLLLLTSLITNAETIKWSFQITDPNHEIFHYDLDDKQFRPFLKKTSWRCSIGVTQKKNQFAFKILRCNYSIKKTGKFTTTLSCGRERPFQEALIDLYDEKKDILFKIKLLCRLEL